jgi:Cu/Ag efflux protein CusF
MIKGVVSMKALLAITLLAASVLAGCAGTQKPSGRAEDVAERRMVVTAIDRQQRVVTLRGQDGGELVVEAGDAIRNFDQIQQGDEVVVTYTEAVAWQVKSASEGAPGMSEKSEVTRAKPGEKPGGTAGRTVSVTATITEIDLVKETVTLTGPRGNAETIKVRDPANLKKVKVGDLVDITYTEAVAIAVRPVAKK